MIRFPNAKINLGLFITHKRSDGYHAIESVFYPVKIQDILELGNFKDSELIQISGIELDGNTNDNLVTKAFHLIENYISKSGLKEKENTLKNLRFYLHKNIPTGAGLGGGSSDGTFALKMLNEKLELNLSTSTLEEFALQLGSDCPFFVRNTPALVKGRGEIIEDFKLDLTGFKLILIHPGIHVSTKDAYSNVQPKEIEFDWKNIQSSTVSNWKNYLVNDFEKTVFVKYPEIKKLKDSLYENGAIYAQMSGSGSAVYGIFEKEKDTSFVNEFHSNKNYKIFTCEL